MSRAPGTVQVCEVWVASARTDDSQPAGTTDELLLETPNWTRDDRVPVRNGDGCLWTFDLADRRRKRLRLGQRLPHPPRQRPILQDGMTYPTSGGAARRTGTSTPDPR